MIQQDTKSTHVTIRLHIIINGFTFQIFHIIAHTSGSLRMTTIGVFRYSICYCTVHRSGHILIFQVPTDGAVQCEWNGNTWNTRIQYHFYQRTWRPVRSVQALRFTQYIVLLVPVTFSPTMHFVNKNLFNL